MEIDGWRGQLYVMGLGTPKARALAAFALSGAVLYATKMPPSAFDDETNAMRPWRTLNPLDESATSVHFLMVPLTIAAGAYLFT